MLTDDLISVRLKSDDLRALITLLSRRLCELDNAVDDWKTTTNDALVKEVAVVEPLRTTLQNAFSILADKKAGRDTDE